MIPDNVEKIIITKEDYDRNVEQLLVDKCKAELEIERLNTNWEVAQEDLSRIAKLLNLEEGCTIYDIEDRIERLNNIIKNIEEERYKLHNANELLENAIDTLRKRNEEIYEGFMATTEELCEATKEIERLNNIIKEVREYIEKVETLAMVDKVNIFSMSTLKTILDKEKDNE